MAIYGIWRRTTPFCHPYSPKTGRSFIGAALKLRKVGTEDIPMIQKFILGVVMVMGVVASAESKSHAYVGTWCHRFDDFTQVLKINADDEVIALSIGNAHGEIVGPERGYASMGATQFLITLGKKDTGVVDFRVSKNVFSGVKKLTLLYKDGSKEKFKSCKVQGLK